MCQFEQLHFCDKGYVVKCTSCGNYQVGFGSTLITLKPDDYLTLYKIVSDRVEVIFSCTDETIKTTVIPTPYRAVKLFLNEKELKSLYEILDSAHSEEQVGQMLKLFTE